MKPYMGDHVCGLHYTIGPTLERRYLPQVKLDSHTTINPVCFTTTLTQTFQNTNSEALSQVRYTFPLYDGVAVCSYTISYASMVFKGIVKQKDVAMKTYQAAVDRGETAGLLESLPAGVFGVTLGNVPKDVDIVVEIKYCGELKHDAGIDGLRYMLPTSIAPRYGSYPGEVLKSNAEAKGGISITVDVDMASSAIRKMQSPSHPIAVSMGGMSTAEGGSEAPFVPSQASATLTLRSTELADDFVLQLLIDDISKPQAILETHPNFPNQRALMTTLVPKFNLEPAHPEVVFIADQSGSMRGSKNASLVSALKVFLKSLPFGVRFNICAFGNSFKFLWPKSQAYNEDNVNTAISFVDSFTASYGGTEILKPITAAFGQRLTDLSLEVMLLTDGEVWGEDAVFDYINGQIRDKVVDARVFALGIGGDVSHTLVEGVARAGNGFAQFVTEDEDADQKVMRMLKGALYAHTKDYELEVHYDETDEAAMTDEDDFEIVEKVNGCLKIADSVGDSTKSAKQEAGAQNSTSFFDTSADVDKPTEGEDKTVDRYAHLPVIKTPKLLQAPNMIPPLFPFNRTTVYLLLGPESVQKKVDSVTLRATSAQGPLQLNIPVYYSNTFDVSTIHQLAARKAVQDLEEGRGWLQAAKTPGSVPAKTKHEGRFDEIVERECVRLGEKFQVAGKWTSFVAVKDDSKDEMDVDAREEQGVPAGRTAGAARYVDPQVSSFTLRASGSLFGGPRCQNFNTEDKGLGSWSMTAPGTASCFRSSQSPSSNSGGGLFGSSATAGLGSNFPSGSNQINRSGHGSSLFGNVRHTTVNRDHLLGTSTNRPFGTDTASSAFGSFQSSEVQSTTFAASSNYTASCFGSSASLSTGIPHGLTEGSHNAISAELTSHSSPSFGMPALSKKRKLTQTRGLPPPAAAPAAQMQQMQQPQQSQAQQIQHLDANSSADEMLCERESEPLQDADADLFASAGMSEEKLSKPHTTTRHNRTNQPARVSTSGKGPRMQLASKAARKPAPSEPDPEVAYVHSMHALINLQTFSGAWAWNDELFSALGISESDVVKEDLGSDSECCATALAIAYLKMKVAGKKDVWEMVASKGRAWLEKQLGMDEVGVDELVENAEVYF